MASTSTPPSELLRTQPAIPSMCASRSTNQRKPTPCTRPRTIKRRASLPVLASIRTLKSHLVPLYSSPRQIHAFSSIHLNFLALVDERRHLHDQPRLGFC